MFLQDLTAVSRQSGIDEKGEQRVLHIFENEELMTQPILTKRGRIIVATQKKLYYLIPKS